MKQIGRKILSLTLTLVLLLGLLPAMTAPAKAKVGDPCTIEVWAYNPSGSLVNTNSYKRFTDYKVGDPFNVHEVFLSMGADGDPVHNIGFVKVYGITNENVINNISGKNVTIAGAGESYVYWESNSSGYTGFKLRLVIEVADTRKSITTCTVSQPSDHIYDGQQYKPSVTVKDGDTTLTEGVDYELFYNGFYGDFSKVLPDVGYETWVYSVYVSGLGDWKDNVRREWKILPADDSISFSGTSVTKTYGDASFTKTVTKAQNGDGTVSYASNNTGVATVNSSSGQVTIKGAGTATITATATKTGTYNYPAPGNTASYTLTVNKATLTATANNKTITYGDAAPTYNISYSGWKNGESTIAAGFTAPTIACAYARYSDKGSYPITLSGGSAKNYNFTLNGGTLTVNAKPVTVTGSVAADKTYDGTTSAEIDVANAEITGLVNGDEITVESATGAFADYNAGEGKTVTVTPALAGGKAGNYVVSPLPTTTATIEKRAVTITAKNQSVELNAPITTGVAQVECDNELLPATDSLTAITLTPTDRNALTTAGTITPSAATIKNGTTNVTGNYEITYVEGNLTVTKGMPVVNVTAPAAGALTYGDTLSLSTLTGGAMKDKYTSAEVPGTFTWETGTTIPDATQGSPANYAVRFTPSDEYATRYETATVNVPVTVAKRVVTLAWTNTALIYNSEEQKPVAAVTNLVGADAVEVTVTGGKTDSNAKAGNTDYTATASALTGERAANYTLTGAADTTQAFTIAQKEITVTALPQTAQCGDASVDGKDDIKLNAATTNEAALAEAVTVVTLAEGDTLTSVTLTGDTAAVGNNLDLTPSDALIKDGAADVTGNYEITFTKGKLTVIPTRPELVTVPVAAALTYGQKLNASALDDTAAVMQDKNTHDPVTGTYAWKAPNTAPDANTDADTGALMYTVVFTPSDTTNYSTQEFEVAVTVNKAELTVTAADKTKTYGAADPELTYTVSGYQNGDNASVLSGALSRAAGEDVKEGGYAINQGALTPNSNYTVAFTGAVLTVTKASQSTPPAAGEGFTITLGKLDIADATNSAANGQTHYEVTDDGGATCHAYNEAAFDIDPSKTYQIRWAAGTNYEASPWTAMKTTASITLAASPANKGTVTGGGTVALNKTVTLTAAPNDDTLYQFGSWKKNGEVVSYDASYSVLADGDASYTAVFVEKEKTVVKLPARTAEAFTYTGGEQTGVKIDGKTEDASFTLENCKATEAGDYIATATLAGESYVWADGTSTPKTVAWSIGKADQAAPTVTSVGSTLTAAPAEVQTPPLVVYYTQDNTKPKSEWTPVPDGGITNAIGMYYFYTKGNNNYNDSPEAQKSGGKPTVVSTLQPTGLTTDSATLNASVSDPDGNITASGVRVKLQWKLASAGSWTDIDAPTYTYGTADPFTVTHSLTGLAANTDYAYRAVATLKNGSEVVGNTISFRTPMVTPPSGSISVTVHSATARDVVVSVEEGNAIISTAETTTSGTVNFTSLPDGFFNVVVRSKDGKYVETRMIAIKDGAGVATAFDVPAGTLSTVVDVKTADTPPVAVEGLQTLITGAEKTAAAGGSKNVEVELEVEKKPEGSAEGSTQIKVLLTSTQQVDLYLDLSLLKTTTELSAGTVTGVTTEDIGKTNTEVLEIAIPYANAKTKADEIEMYRYHGTSAEKLTKLNAKPGTDRTFFVDQENGYIFLYASGFSTYAIAVKKTTSNHYSGGGGGYSPTAVTPAKPTGAVNGTSGVCPKDTTCPIWPFIDAETTAWYHDGVHYCLENGIMRGMGDGLFAPNGNTTRAQMAQILYNLENKPAYSGTVTYSDVYANYWYTDAIRYVSVEGIMEGYGDGTFGPDDAITREQLVTIMYRYARYKGVDISAWENADILRYDDVFSISSWAAAAFRWACGSGTVNGKTETTLNPLDAATRAEIATIIMRYCENVAK